MNVECGFIATQQNFKILKICYYFIAQKRGNGLWRIREGKMSSPRQIYAYLKNYFERDILKVEILKGEITGPTREYLDPVRYISNNQGKTRLWNILALKKLE